MKKREPSEPIKKNEKLTDEALLVEYQVCQEDNSAIFQGFWTLAAIFIGLSSVFFAGLIYAVIANESLLSILLCHNEPRKTVVIGVIALIIGIANVVILKKLKGWHKRIMLNQRVNLKRMLEIEFQLGMQRGWQHRAIDEWYKKCGGKKPTEDSEEVWKELKPLLEKEIDPRKSAGNLDTLKDDLVNLIQRYFPKGHDKDRDKYELPSSEKHFPCILYTMILLWVLVAVMAAFLIIIAAISLIAS